jgi:hypothetical protein
LQSAGIGSIFTVDYTDKISSDFNAGYLLDLLQLSDNQYFIGIDNGLYIGNVQYILGLNYLQSQKDKKISENLFLSPGITVEPAKNFLFVLSMPISVYRKNDFLTKSFTFALTITIN